MICSDWCHNVLFYYSKDVKDQIGCSLNSFEQYIFQRRIESHGGHAPVFHWCSVDKDLKVNMLSQQETLKDIISTTNTDKLIGCWMSRDVQDKRGTAGQSYRIAP